MPIDPNIPLMARPTVPVQSPIEALSQVLQIRNAQQQQQSGALELQEKKNTADSKKPPPKSGDGERSVIDLTIEAALNRLEEELIRRRAG